VLNEAFDSRFFSPCVLSTSMAEFRVLHFIPNEQNLPSFRMSELELPRFAAVTRSALNSTILSGKVVTEQPARSK
jgi:hypothetical protein